MQNTSAKGDGESREFALLQMRLMAFIREDAAGGYVVYCPALDVCSQGDTIAEAKKNIIEATQCFLEGCYEMGTLNKVLLECGFQFAGKKQPPGRAKTTAGNWRKSFSFPARFPLAAGYRRLSNAA
ncbi:MAG: type II toxin-antitoxin system HicB family antitoxin [Gammaproteobacteria bacterium]